MIILVHPKSDVDYTKKCAEYEQNELSHIFLEFFHCCPSGDNKKAVTLLTWLFYQCNTPKRTISMIRIYGYKLWKLVTITKDRGSNRLQR